MHSIERELIKATEYKARAKFIDRQDYLKSVLNAVAKLPDDVFNELSDETAAWTNAAVEAHNSKKDIPDFDEMEPDEDEEAEDGEPEADSADTEDGGAEGADTADTNSDEPDEDEDDPENDPEDEEPVDELPQDQHIDEDDGDDEPPTKPAKAKKAPKPAKAVAKPTKPVVAKKITRDVKDDPEVEMDKWHCMVGSKNSRALSLFEKGATVREVKEAIGGTYYNILAKMVESGHRMEKEGHVITLTHKDNLNKKSAVVKKKK